jgi:hypothetical protein
MDHGEGTCLTSNIVARWSKINLRAGDVFQLKTQLLRSNWGTCFNIVFVLVNVKYQIKYADGVFYKQRLDKANALGEISSKNRGVLSGEKKWGR